MAILLIKNGTVIDPANHLHTRVDVAVEDGKILSVGYFENTPDFEIDATGCYVTPGLIDHHMHAYPLIPKGIPAEAICFASGVTSVSDAGSTGCAT